MTPRLVAFDLDGTLVGKNLGIRPRVERSIRAMREQGVLGCIVTGRMYRSAQPFARDLGFGTPVVCYQGAAIIDPSSGNFIFDTPLANTEALEVVAYSKACGLHVQLYADDRYFCEATNRFSDLYAHVSGVAPIVVASLEQEFAARDATKAVIIAEPEVAAAHLPLLAKQLGARAYVTRSLPAFIEVTNPQVDKGRALRLVAGQLNIAMTDVMAIGDSWNDAPLLRAAAFGVAMGSAPPELKEIADALVNDVEHDGVADAIERFVTA
ncbi:MAG: Cof-type HAD-IIB family hydrolase [Candidatus Eremiobacteraeota bacterium]|nr:Cof-type HAD-IIB family hydrolase [Candidatus Eremiobacteraeota bacterium]